MVDIEEIKSAILRLSPKAQAELRAWYEQLDAQNWDQQFKEDVAAGRLDALADEAVRAFRSGDYTEL